MATTTSTEEAHRRAEQAQLVLAAQHLHLALDAVLTPPHTLASPPPRTAIWVLSGFLRSVLEGGDPTIEDAARAVLHHVAPELGPDARQDVLTRVRGFTESLMRPRPLSAEEVRAARLTSAFCLALRLYGIYGAEGLAHERAERTELDGLE